MAIDQSFRKYYQTDRYKGFYKIKERIGGSSRMSLLVFSNGKKKIYANGVYVEEAMAKVFKAIDKYHSSAGKKNKMAMQTT